MGGRCDHDYVFLIGCGAMACIACAHHISVAHHTAMQERVRVKAHSHYDCRCGWAEGMEENNDD